MFSICRIDWVRQIILKYIAGIASEFSIRYFEAFILAPILTVSIIRGGGIQEWQTFHNTAGEPIPTEQKHL